MEGTNPYAPPTDDFLAVAPTNDHEATRRRLIGTEGNIRSLGALIIVGGALSIPMGIGTASESPVTGLIALVLAGVALYGGVALRNLDSLGRALFTVLASLAIVSNAWSFYVVSSLMSPPTGMVVGMGASTVVFALFLALVWGKNAREIFTDHYRGVVIPATSYVKYKTSLIAIAVLAIVVLLLASVVVATLAR